MSRLAQLQIIDEIKARLANISKANGYSFDLKKITRSKGTIFSNGDLPEADLWIEGIHLTEQNYGKDFYSLDVHILSWTNRIDKKITDEISAKMGADFQIAVNRTVDNPSVLDSPDYYLSDLCNKILLLESSYQSNIENSWVGVQLTFNVTFSTPKGDPFTIKNI